MCARGLGLRQIVLAAADDDLLAVLDEVQQHPLQAEQPRLAIHQRQQRDAEGLLQRRQLEQVGQHLARLDGARHLDADAHPRAVGLVAQVGDALQPAVAHQLGNALQQVGLVRHVRQLGDDDAGAIAAHVLDVRLGLHHDVALAARVGVGDHIHLLGRLAAALALVAVDHAAGREIGAGDELHQVLDGDVVMAVVVVDQVARARRTPRPGCAAGCWSPCRPRCRWRR